MNPLNLLMNPFVLVLTTGLLLVIVFAILASRATSPRKRAVFSTLGLIALLLPSWLVVAIFFPQWIDGRHRAYKNFYDDISLGMTREQVLNAMEKNYPHGGPRKRPKTNADTTEELSFFMDPESSREPNHEGIILELSDGKVARKAYSRD
jgi:xanthosine utilization system XapX-like protein